VQKKPSRYILIFVSDSRIDRAAVCNSIGKLVRRAKRALKTGYDDINAAVEIFDTITGEPIAGVMREDDDKPARIVRTTKCLDCGLYQDCSLVLCKAI
jgi:hypothetical protein